MFADPSFFRSLAALHRAGIAWPQAVASAAGSDAGAAAPVRALSDGSSLADALGPVVDPLDRAMLEAGEASGRLEGTLERIATRHEEEARLSGARQAALAYPVVMGHIAALLVGIPDYIATPSHVGRGLLWTLAILIPLWLVLWLTSPRRPKANPDHPGTKAPEARGLRRSAIEEADARALLALADGYESGLRLSDTLRLASQAGAGGRVAFDLYRAGPRILDGEPLASAWSAVPESVGRTLRVAEEVGELGDASRRQAAMLSFGVQMRRKKIASLLPLGLMLLVGVAIAWRVIGFYVGYVKDLSRF